MNKVTLGQILQYLDQETGIIQIVDGGEWDIYQEMEVNSDLLKPVKDYLVIALRCEVSNDECLPVIRVQIEKGENYGYRLEKEADLPEVLGGCVRVRCDADYRFRRHTGNGGADHGDHYGWSICAGLHYRRRAG